MTSRRSDKSYTVKTSLSRYYVSIKFEFSPILTIAGLKTYHA